MIDQPQCGTEHALDLRHVQIVGVAVCFAQHEGDEGLVLRGKLDLRKILCYVGFVGGMVHVRVLQPHPGRVTVCVLVEGDRLDVVASVDTELPCFEAINVFSQLVYRFVTRWITGTWTYPVQGSSSPASVKAWKNLVSAKP